jgi:hypothetical protein
MTDTQHQPDRSRIIKRAVLAGIIIGVLLGLIAFVLVFVFPIWRPIMAPPEKAVELLAYRYNAFDDYTLYIRAASGDIYAYRSSDYGASDVEWRQVEQVKREENSYKCNFGGFSTPIPPGKIVSQLESHPCIVDAESQVNHILLEDSSIWKWEKTTGELDMLLIPLGAFVAAIAGLIGAVAGMLIGIAIVKFKKVEARS